MPELLALVTSQRGWAHDSSGPIGGRRSRQMESRATQPPAEHDRLRASSQLPKSPERHLVVDSTGNLVARQLGARVVSLEPDSLHSVPFVIGLAAGSEKADAIAAALRGRYLDALVVDVDAAQTLAHLPETGNRSRLDGGCDPKALLVASTNLLVTRRP